MDRLEDYYHKEGSTFLIEINLREARQIFDSLDPAPFHDKDLDADAEVYIIESVKEFAIKTPMQLVIYLPVKEAESDDAKAIPAAICNYFEYQSQRSRKELRFVLLQGRTSLIIGLLFLFFCISAREGITALLPGTAGNILDEGLLISGWVAMWRPIQIFLYDWWPIGRRRRLFEKIKHMDIEIRSVKEPERPASDLNRRRYRR